LNKDSRRSSTRKSYNLFLFSAILILLFSSCVSASDSELITNGNFENNLNNWYSGYWDGQWQSINPLYIDTSSLYGYSGNYANFKYVDPAAYEYLQQPFNLSNGCNITFSYYVNTSDSGNAFCFILDLNTNNRVFPEHDGMSWYTTKWNQWEKISLNGYLPAGNYKIVFWTHSHYPMKIDDISVTDNDHGLISGEISASAGVFEFGKWGTYTVDIANGQNNTDYYVDVYGEKNGNYTFLSTESFTHLNAYPENLVVITAPQMTAGYEQLYAVLRDGSNNTLDNTTDPLVADRSNYFAWIPSVIGYNEKSTLRYNYNYSGKYLYDADYEIQNIYNWDPEDLYFSTYLDHNVVVDNLNNVSSGSFEYTSGNLSYMYYEIKNGKYTGHNYTKYPKEYRKYALFRNEWDGTYSTKSLNQNLVSAVLVIDPDKQTPQVPNYVPNPTPENQSEVTPDNPELPPNYQPPSYPHPSNPHDETEEEGGEQVPNPDYDPAYQPNTTYDPDTHSWSYDNTSAYNGTDGYFPVDVPGNTSVDTSRFQGFYDKVDTVYSPLNNTVYGFFNFILSPIISITKYITELKNYLLNSVSGLIDPNIITECIVPVFANLPPQIIALIVFGLVLTLIGLLLRGG
jgi:hypothetical protein